MTDGSFMLNVKHTVGRKMPAKYEHCERALKELNNSLKLLYHWITTSNIPREEIQFGWQIDMTNHIHGVTPTPIPKLGINIGQ